MRHVTPLDVGDDEQARAARSLDRLGERLPSGRAEALETRDLGLHRDAPRAGSLDQLETVLADGGGRAGFRVQAQAYLAAPRLDEGGEPVRERCVQCT
jgi:hypothetical protein